MIDAVRTVRVRRDAEDAADGCELSVTELERYDWLCPRCREHNGKWDDWCFFCKWDREIEAWLCDDCGHLNPLTAKRCEQCGRKREGGRD